MKVGRRDGLLFAAALAVRLAHVLAERSGPLLKYLFIDSAFYDGFARGLAQGALPSGPFFMNVLYGFVLGGVYAVFGSGHGGHVAALVLQAGLGSVSVVLTHRLGIAVRRPREGLAAAVALTLLGPAVFYDGALLTPTLLLFLTVATTLVAVRALGGDAAGVDVPGRDVPGRLGLLFGLGVLTGLLVLGRANHALLLPVWIGVLAWRQGRGAWRGATAVLLGAALVVAPVTARNARESDELVWVTANGGMALFAGNHPQATGIYSQPAFLTNPVPAREAEDYRAEASRRAGQELTLAQSSRFWTGETLRRWRSHPGPSLAMALRKLRLYFHATESQTNLSYYFARDFSRPLALLPFHLGWFLPFTIIGLAWDARRYALLAAPIGVSLATCVLFYVSSEYRHPVAPLILLFAAFGASRVLGWVRSGSPVTVRAGAAAAVLAVLVFVNYRDPFLARLQSRRVDYLNFATLAADAGDLDDAERFARRSIRIDPHWDPSRRRLAEILARRRRSPEAAEVMAALPGASELDSARAEAQRLFSARRFEEALARFRRIAADEHDEAKAVALNNGGLCAMRLGRSAEAESLFTAAREEAPAYASPVVHLGRLALVTGDSAAAVARAREALELDPDDGRARRLLERALGQAVDSRTR